MATTKPERDAYLVEHVREHLLRDHRIGELDIHVTVEGTVVFIRGHVSTSERRDAISIVLDGLLPEYQVMNETTVAVYPEAPEDGDA